MELPKKIGRDLIEYILLISFVSLGSSFVLVSEIKAPRTPQNFHSGAAIQTVTRTPKRGAIFGLSTKRHIK
jgi:hypothetical protein